MMTERHALTTKEPPDIHEDWSTLIARAADDVTRIVHSEIQLFETSFRSALEGHINYALAGLAMVGAMICGILCALVALILYAHQWMPLWQACAIAALIMFAAAGVIRATVLVAPSKIPSPARPDSNAISVGQTTTNPVVKQ
jgi:uncharacterized membrane protein YfcA